MLRGNSNKIDTKNFRNKIKEHGIVTKKTISNIISVRSKTKKSSRKNNMLYPQVNPEIKTPLQSGLTTFCEMNSDWYTKRLEYYKERLIVHRKQWEIMSCIQSIEEHGMLAPGRKGLVFGVGKELMPSMFASKGAEILATDAPVDLNGTKNWSDTNQHAASKEQLYYSDRVSREDFDKLVSFQFVDMNHIPREFYGQFDFVWSICALEHLGNIEKGLDFIINASKCLKTNGMFFHTTEFNLTSNDDTLDNNSSVFFRKKDMEELERRLIKENVMLYPINYNTGSHIYDLSPSSPPDYPIEPHLKVVFSNHTVTCIRLIGKVN